MDQIYRDAYLTIIASAGNGPHHGLPGVNATPHRPLNRFVVGPYVFATLGEVQSEIRRSNWNSRGWTYQESILSHRRLVFAESEVYFECQDMCCLESVTLPPTIKHRRIFPIGGIGHVASDIYYRILDFWHRQLTWDGDRLHALQGIFTAFEGKVNKWRKYHCGAFKAHFWGIPVFSGFDGPGRLEQASFKSGLLFTYFALPHDMRNSAFPTWSWAGRDKRLGRYNFYETYLRFREDGIGDFGRTINKWSTSLINILHKSGESVEIGNFTYISRNYKDFRPHLDITSWSVWATVTAIPGNEHRFFGSVVGTEIKIEDRLTARGEIVLHETVEVRFDYLDNNWHNKRLLLVYIQAYADHWTTHWIDEPGKDAESKETILEERYRTEKDPKVTVYCLLLEETKSSTYRRVGLWKATIPVQWDSMSVDEFFTEHCKPTVAGADEKWEKRTVRVV